MARRKSEVFSLSFLDVICCGFGAVVLFYTIISAQSGLEKIKETEDRSAEASLLERQVLEGYKNLADLRNTLAVTDSEKARAAKRAADALKKIEETQQELARFQYDTLARREALERLKADLKSLEEDTRRLQAESTKPKTGLQVRATPGDGDRQYLTGLKVGGQRILVLVDASTSMLDETLVNVIRMRNMADERKLRSDKWRQAIGVVDWVAAQLPPDSRFQMYAFNVTPWPLYEGSSGRWLESKDTKSLNGALQALRKTVPQQGTSLENAFAVINTLSPRPDNVILITDGLPTQGARPPAIKKLVDTEDREDHMQKAIRALGNSPPPINVVLLPMEGDPAAPVYFWRLAQVSGGAFLSPPRDWP